MATEPQLGQILLQAGVIDEFQLQAALDEHVRRGHRLGLTLVRLGFSAERDIVRALGHQLGLPIASLDGKRVDDEVLELVPADLAAKHLVVPLFVKAEASGRALYLGMEDPCDLVAREEVAARAGMAVRPVVVAASELAVAIDRLYRGPGRAPLDDGALEVDWEEQLQIGNADTAVDFDAAQSATADCLERVGSPEPADAARAREPAGPSGIRRARGEADTRVILQALTQILIEQGLIERAELVERVARIEAGDVRPHHER